MTIDDVQKVADYGESIGWWKTKSIEEVGDTIQLDVEYNGEDISEDFIISVPMPNISIGDIAQDARERIDGLYRFLHRDIYKRSLLIDSMAAKCPSLKSICKDQLSTLAVLSPKGNDP